MKKYLVLLFGLFFYTSCFSMDVWSYVSGQIKDDDGEFCCIEMHHIYFINGIPVGHGNSYGGINGKNCCPSSSQNVSIDSSVPDDIRLQIEEFNNSPAFQVSIDEAIYEFILENNNQMGVINTNYKSGENTLVLSFYSPNDDEYSLSILPFVSGNTLNQKIQAKKGINQIEVNYMTSELKGIKQKYLIKLLSSNWGCRELTTL